MKCETLIVLSQIGEIHSLLMAKWRETKKEDPVAEAWKVMRAKKISKLVIFCSIILLACALSGLMFQSFLTAPGMKAEAFLTFFSIFGAVFFLLGGFSLIETRRESEFGRMLAEFAKTMQLNYGQLVVLTDDDLKKRADETLFRAARSVQMYQEDGSSGLTQPADEARAQFKRKHELFQQFGLADKKWDRYFKENPVAKATTS